MSLFSRYCNSALPIRPLRKPGTHGLRALLCLTLPCLLSLSHAWAQNSVRAFALAEPLALGEAHWTGGFWQDRFETCRTQMVPGMWRLMEGTNYTQFYQNFRIAAGLAEGRARGAAFNDGDFYKWLEGACAVLAVTRDPELDRLLDEIVGVIAKAQRADGYIHTPVLIRLRNGDATARPFQDRNNFEMYNMGHLLTTACVHYQVTGKTNLLTVARKTADFLDEAFRQPAPEVARNSVCPSHYMGMVELYRVTREPRYLHLAKKFLQLRESAVEGGGDDNQDRLPFSKQTEAAGHAVRANYLYAGAADLYLETGATNLWQPLERLWTNVVSKKLYLTGGCGALYDGASPDGAKDQKSITRVHQAYGRNYELPNTTAHNETCANIGNVLWDWRMFQASGGARYLDIAEVALYNSVLSGAALDGTNFFYVNPLRQTDPLPVDLRWSRTRVPFVSSFCCPPNLVRTIAESASYAYAKSTNALWVNLYGSSVVRTKLAAGGEIALTQETEYPWSGHVRLTVTQGGSGAFAIKLRIPGWARGARVRVNDRPAETVTEPGAFFEVRRAWQAGDFIDLDLPMTVQVMEANPLVEETLGEVAFKRGPIVYCLESTDLPQGRRIMEISVPQNVDLVARYDQRLLGGVVVLDGFLSVAAGETWGDQLYREFKPPKSAPVRVRMIPYYVWANRGKSEMTVWLPHSPL